MKKSLVSALLTIAWSASQILHASDAGKFPNVGTGCTMVKVKIPEQKFFQSELAKRQDIYYNVPLFLTEDQVNNPDKPIDVPFNSTIVISLQGEESNSQVYCSGGGSQHGYRWELDDDNIENNFLMATSVPPSIIHTDSLNPKPTNNRWDTQQTHYQWSFFPKQTGLATLKFKKYYYSNAMIRNFDDSLPWKDPVETIQFTINVVDDVIKSAGSH